MKSFFTDLYQYHHHYNQQFIELAAEHQQQLEPQVHPLLSHTLNAQQIWNARILDETAVGVHQLWQYAEMAAFEEANFQQSLKILEQLPLEQVVYYQNSKGTRYANTVQEVLFHAECRPVANHFTHHKGQLVASFRRSGITPPATDYIFYKRS